MLKANHQFERAEEEVAVKKRIIATSKRERRNRNQTPSEHRY